MKHRPFVHVRGWFQVYFLHKLVPSYLRKDVPITQSLFWGIVSGSLLLWAFGLFHLVSYLWVGVIIAPTSADRIQLSAYLLIMTACSASVLGLLAVRAWQAFSRRVTKRRVKKWIEKVKLKIALRH